MVTKLFRSEILDFLSRPVR